MTKRTMDESYDHFCDWFADQEDGTYDLRLLYEASKEFEEAKVRSEALLAELRAIKEV